MKLKYYIQKFLAFFLKEPIVPNGRTVGYSLVKSERFNSTISEKAKVYTPFFLHNVEIGDFSYVANNSSASNVKVGRFCSIGPNFCCGLGIHPIDGVSTSPMFYSTCRQNGFSLCDNNKIEEFRHSNIGHDVFIGANVTVLDGVSIGTGAVIGAGAVVTHDIPPYAVAVGVPAKIVKYRFDPDTVERLLSSEWWLYEDRLEGVEQYFFDIESFLSC